MPLLAGLTTLYDEWTGQNMDSEPFVSCIMPTCNRRAFVPRAIQYFLRQDYPQRELIILDDGSDPVGDLIPADERIRYIRMEKRLTLGAKRNLACEQARGDLLMHWDDDDWHAPRRITYQVEALLQADAEICGLRQMLFYDPASRHTWLYTYPAGQRPWLAGGSLLYRRSFWQRSPFPNLRVGEDTRFVWSHSLEQALVLSDYTFYIALIHPANTSPKKMRGSYWKLWDGDLREVMGKDLDFYQPTAQPVETNVQPVMAKWRKPMKLNLGCLDVPLSDFVNVDLIVAPGVNQVTDLSTTWPWADDSIEFVRVSDILEHLPDKIHTMNELWRVLAPGGQAEIIVPTTEGSGAFQDPTHISFWNRRSFLYYESGNPYRERFARYYGIQARFRVIREHTDDSSDGPRLTILLEAVKP
jgi:hypothetical protein